MQENITAWIRRAPVREHLTAFLALATANGVLYADYWLGDNIFSGKDFLTAFYPLLNFQVDCLQDGSWPLWNPFMNFGYPYVEHYVNSAFFPTHLFMGLVTGSSLHLIQRELLFWVLLGGFGTYLCVREFGLSAATGILSGISFMGCGQIIALPQWSILVYNAACFPFLILGYHRAKRQDLAFNPTSIAFLALTIFGGYIVTTVLGIYLFAGYVLLDAAMSRRTLFGVRYLGITIAAAIVITLPKLLPLYAGMDAGPRLASASPPAGAPRDTFNIVSPYNLLSLLLPVKYYFSLFLGTTGTLALVQNVLKKRIRITPLAVMALVSGWLLISGTDGSPSLLRDIVSRLPFMRLVRNDWLSWFFPTIFAILFLARPIEELIAHTDRRDRYIAGGVYAAMLTLAFLSAYDNGFYASAYLVHLGIAAVLLFLPSLPGAIAPGGTAAALLLVELALVFHRVNVNMPPVRQGDRLLYTIVDQGSVSRSYREDNLIRSAFPAIALDDRLRPTIDQAREHPVLFSGLHGMPGINYSQEQYGMFIDDMNLKRFSGWWYNTQERFEFIRLKESLLLPGLDGIPLFTFADRADGELPPVVHLNGLSCSSFDFQVASPVPGLFLLRQMFDARWSARIDGRPAAVLRVDDHFMGVEMDAGEHRLRLLFRDRTFSWSAMTSLAALAGMLGWVIIRKKCGRNALRTSRTSG